MNTEEFLASINEHEREIYRLHSVLKFWMNVETVLEIGSGWGIFTGSVCRLYPHIRITTLDKDHDLKTFDKNTNGFESKISRAYGASKDYLPTVASDSFDVVFIDGDHSYEGAKADLIQAYRIIKEKGYIIVDDVCHVNNWIPEKNYGVNRALAEFCMEHELHFITHPAAHGIAVIPV